jgi:hypothetical protein
MFFGLSALLFVRAAPLAAQQIPADEQPSSSLGHTLQSVSKSPSRVAGLLAVARVTSLVSPCISSAPAMLDR